MTVTEIAQITGKSRDTILKMIHDLLPKKEITAKRKIVLNKEEVEVLLGALEPDYRIQQKTDEKKTKVLHLSIKRDLNAATLKEMSKYLSKEEIREYILQTTHITGFKQLEEPEEEKKDE